MEKSNVTWTIKELIERREDIDLSVDYQREPSIWDLSKKRKLIDSVLRGFDIAGIYLYERERDRYDCLDGKQRITSIISYMGLNEGGEDNNFIFTSDDELLGSNDLDEYNNKSYYSLNATQQKRIDNFQINIIIIKLDAKENDTSLNLLFLRLQLGMPLNAGEKLHAMVGEMKKYIFENIGKHKLFDKMHIPKRRFWQELTAAQITLNYFSLNTNGIFSRARFIDLQDFVKEYINLSSKDKKILDKLKNRLDEINTLCTTNILPIDNRANALSFFFFLDHLIENSKTRKNTSAEVTLFLQFFSTFIKKLKSETKKGIAITPKYRDLLKYQTYMTQAAVEKYAIENRHRFLTAYFDYYKANNGKIMEDYSGKSRSQGQLF